MRAREVAGLDPSGSLQDNAARIVRTRLEELRGFAEGALTPEAAEAQHSMRIAAKRLRYVLELVGPCIGEEAKAARNAAKRLQSVLGDLHDCDLMLPKVEHIRSLEVLLQERRARHFREFVELWQAEASKGTWAKLATSL
jgi:CHAD domain-containing protein